MHGVVRRFPVVGDVVTALDHVDVSIPVAQMMVVAGPSGSGKSTLLALLACMQRPDEGNVSIGDTDVRALSRRARRELRRDRLGIVLPQPSENLLDQFDASTNVRWAAHQRQRPRHADAAVDVELLLESVGLSEARGRRVRELSGGEQQRLAVACALAGRPELVILDEPTASLDRAGAVALVEVLASIAEQGSTLVIASHDPMVVEAANVIVALDHGRRVR
ncbi:MAG: putative transport system ATP-binding protein [Ilumatobacteraceae bacterium]